MNTPPHPHADQRADALTEDRGQTGHTPPVTTKRIYHAVGSSFTYTICPSGDTHTQAQTDAPAAHTTAAAARAQDAGVPLGSTDALAPLFDAATIRAQHTAGVSIGDMVQFIREVRPTCTFIQAFAEVRAGLDTTRSSVSLLPPLFVARPMADAGASATSNSASPPPSYTPTYALAVMRRAQLAPHAPGLGPCRGVGRWADAALPGDAGTGPGAAWASPAAPEQNGRCACYPAPCVHCAVATRGVYHDRLPSCQSFGMGCTA